MRGGRFIAILLFALAPAPETALALPDVDSVTAEPGRGSVIEMDPRALVALEQRGFSLVRLMGGHGRSNAELAALSRFAGVIATLDSDVSELSGRPGIGPLPAPNRPFDTGWLRDARARFELTAVVHRLDRRFVAGCGELRLLYRLVLEPDGRPPTALPMTVNVIFQQSGDCRAAAQAWSDLPLRGRARVDALASLIAGAGPFVKLETNLQSLHGPALREREDDHAEYLLRSFERHGDALVPAFLLDTPRELDEADRAALVRWVGEHFAEIDAGGFVLPDRFLAKRAVSVAPRGAARKRNRLFAAQLSEHALADLPYASAAIVKSPRGLLRRLDEASCVGCHESRAIAGFHVLGEDRDPERRFNALAVGRSAHLESELDWRAALVAAAARGERFDVPRPFAERAAPGPGPVGARCALDDDPTFASWSCAPGLHCRDLYGDILGMCAPTDGNHEGDACEDVRVEPLDGPDGDRIHAASKEGCSFGGETKSPEACSPNHFGFPGGMCSNACTELGKTKDGFVCADLPAAGYESDCFPNRVPIETCLLTHSARLEIRGCDAIHPCRDDFACARVPGLPAGAGACVPPYFVFQARVDGPALDR